MYKRTDHTCFCLYQILESVAEVLFQLCDDADSDIRLVASDCLNRIMKVRNCRTFEAYFPCLQPVWQS